MLRALASSDPASPRAARQQQSRISPRKTGRARLRQFAQSQSEKLPDLGPRTGQPGASQHRRSFRLAAAGGSAANSPPGHVMLLGALLETFVLTKQLVKRSCLRGGGEGLGGGGL